MENSYKSSSHVQMHAENVIFQKVEALLNIRFERNKKIYLADNAFTYESLDEEDWKSPDNSYRQAWEKVIEAMADALIDSWHSLCTARGIQLRKGK